MNKFGFKAAFLLICSLTILGRVAHATTRVNLVNKTSKATLVVVEGSDFSGFPNWQVSEVVPAGQTLTKISEVPPGTVFWSGSLDYSPACNRQFVWTPGLVNVTLDGTSGTCQITGGNKVEAKAPIDIINLLPESVTFQVQACPQGQACTVVYRNAAFPSFMDGGNIAVPVSAIAGTTLWKVSFQGLTSGKAATCEAALPQKTVYGLSFNQQGAGSVLCQFN